MANYENLSFQHVEIPKNGDFISVAYSVFPCITEGGIPLHLYVVQHMKVTDEVTFDPKEVTDRWNDKEYLYTNRTGRRKRQRNRLIF